MQFKKDRSAVSDAAITTECDGLLSRSIVAPVYAIRAPTLLPELRRQPATVRNGNSSCVGKETGKVIFARDWSF